MDTKTLNELDYYRIRDEISQFCLAEESRFIMNRLEPFTNLEEINHRKELSKEWLNYINSTRSSALTGWPQVYNIFKSLKVLGSALSLEQTYSIGQFCNSVTKVSTALQSAETDLKCNSLAELTKTIPDLKNVSDSIFRIITQDGELRDLPELREIRNRIAQLNAKIKGIMHSFTSDSRYADILESTVPVLRGGRQVLAVKSSRRIAIPGIIHEVSQTGQTVFIEPDESVKCSNDLIQAEFDLAQETRKILLELADKIRPYHEDLIQALKIMEKIDIAHAAARWAKINSCIFASDCKNQSLILIGARHPILGDKAVPIDVKFMDGKKILIITGPNTGGKTVTLKTIALFAMLNQTGFPIPAKEGTRLPIFSGVFADIGDEQSMDESLSTFSGHMKNIARALRNVKEDSLVLLDELGSGTDPQEGAAISMAVLDKLIEKNAYVLITTHQGVIKNYGYTHEKCINASVEFNTNTLSPTYHILMGVPGESHALDVAKKSGLPSEIVSKAKNYLVNEKTDVSSLIKGLTSKHAELDKLYSDFQQKEQNLEDKIFKNENKSLELKQKELELKQGYQTESEIFLQESRKKLENLVRILKEGEITREKTLSVKSFISDLTDEIKQREKELEIEEEELQKQKEILVQKEKIRISHKPTKKRMKNADALKTASQPEIQNEITEKQQETPLKFEPGAQVISIKNKMQGVILSSAGKSRWNVQFGSLSIIFKQSELELVKAKDKPKASISYDLLQDTERNAKPVFELRLLGLRAEEALKALERQLDLCILSNFKNFSVIHGKGNGVLQQTVHDYLSNCPSVKEFKFASPEDGGFGKTYVTLH